MLTLSTCQDSCPPISKMAAMTYYNVINYKTQDGRHHDNLEIEDSHQQDNIWNWRYRPKSKVAVNKTTSLPY